MKNINEIKKIIIENDNIARCVEYILSSVISDGISPKLEFIYKNHKIIRNNNKKYSIYNLKTKRKIYSDIKYQDMAKYIIDNINNYTKIKNIFDLEKNVSRLREKIDFLKVQYYYSNNKNIIEAKIENAYTTYNIYKMEFLKTLKKNNIC